MRLTNEKRDAIIKKESNDKFYDKIQKAEEDFKKTIDTAVSKTVPKYILDSKIDQRYVKRSNTVDIKGIKDKRNTRRYGGSSQREDYELNNYYPSPNSMNHKIKLTKIIQSKIDKVNKLKDEQEEFKKKLRKTLYSFTTYKKMIDTIPELKKYADNLPVVSSALVPIQEIQEVRKMLR